MPDMVPGGARPTILVVEDEIPLLTLLRYNLEKQGFRVEEAADGQEALVRVAESRPDLVLLDWMLPALSGLEVCRQLRRRPATRDLPIIMVTARTEQQDTVRALDTGADDYISKPFAMDGLLARIRALLRRSRGPEQATPAAPAEPGPSGGGWQLSLERRELWRADGRTCPLTTAEFELLRMLVERRGEPVTRQELMLAVFRRPWKADDRAVDTVVRKLRRKISGDHGDGGIKTVRPTGYIFVGFPNTGSSDRLS